MHLFPRQSRNTAKYRYSLALLAIFLYAQWETLLHTEVHAFHEHDEVCSIFANLEQQSNLICAVDPDVSLPNPGLEHTAFFTPDVTTLAPIVFLARAPPCLDLRNHS